MFTVWLFLCLMHGWPDSFIVVGHFDLVAALDVYSFFSIGNVDLVLPSFLVVVVHFILVVIEYMFTVLWYFSIGNVDLFLPSFLVVVGRFILVVIDRIFLLRLTVCGTLALLKMHLSNVKLSQSKRCFTSKVKQDTLIKYKNNVQNTPLKIWAAITVFFMRDSWNGPHTTLLNFGQKKQLTFAYRGSFTFFNTAKQQK